MTVLRGGVKLPYGTVRLTATEAISTITATAIPWDTAIDDEYSMYSGASPTRLTPPSWATLVRHGSSAQWQNETGGYRHLWQHQSGSQAIGRGSNQLNILSATAEHTMMAWSAPLINSSNYYETLVYQNSGASRNILATPSTWQSIVILGTT